MIGPSGSGGLGQAACPSCDEMHVSAAGIAGVGQFCAPRPPPGLAASAARALTARGAPAPLCRPAGRSAPLCRRRPPRSEPLPVLLCASSHPSESGKYSACIKRDDARASRLLCRGRCVGTIGDFVLGRPLAGSSAPCQGARAQRRKRGIPSTRGLHPSYRPLPTPTATNPVGLASPLARGQE